MLGLLLATMSWMVLGVVAPRWRLGAAMGPAANWRERALERLLRGLFVLSCYQGVWRLAYALQEVVHTRPLPMQAEQTRLGRVYRLGELDFLLQMFKTLINYARLVLASYVDPGGIDPAATDTPERAAQALAIALTNFRRGRRVDAPGAQANPLRDSASFNDERFLAAVWQAYQRDHLARSTSRR
jgi:hypothetical protein